jgi:hypothetical protein
MGRRLVFVSSAQDAPSRASDVDVVALDTAWTPGPGDPTHVIPLRTAVGPVLARIDLFADALTRLEAWEDAAGLADRMMADGVSWWYRQRPFIWYLLHEHRLWLAILDELGARRVEAIEIRADEPVLADVASRLMATTGGRVDSTVPPPVPPDAPAPRAEPPPNTQRSLVARIERRIRRGLVSHGPSHLRPAERPDSRPRPDEGRLAVLDDRADRLMGDAGKSVLVLSHPRVFQVVVAGDRPRLMDPQLAPVMMRLTAEGVPIIHVALELDLRQDDDWARIEADDRLLPDSYIRRRWGREGTAEPPPLPAVLERLEEVRAVPLDVDDVDLAPPLLDRLAHVSDAWLTNQLRLARRAGRMFADLRPAALFLNHEGIRTPWLAGARAVGVPIHAVQHGIIYPTHPVYRHERHPGLIYPDRTYVYGPFEREVLLDWGHYRPAEVQVSGSPRLDVVDVDAGARRDAIRDEVRRELGVADGHRLIVLSTANHVLAWRFHIADAMARVLDGPMPDVHVVIKLHPGEKDEGPYRSLIEGLARAGGYPAPPLTIIHDIDLFRLLQAADAHLGFHSTVLTDAVAAGTPNLIAAGHATADLLGYVEAGVATQVQDADQLRAAIADPPSPDPAVRRAFLERHFRAGDASARIAAGITAGHASVASADVAG